MSTTVNNSKLDVNNCKTVLTPEVKKVVVVLKEDLPHLWQVFFGLGIC